MSPRPRAGPLGASWPSWLLAAVVAGSAQALLWQQTPGSDGRGLDVALVVVATVPLVWVRRRPLTMFAIVGGAALLHVVLGYQNPFPVTFSVLVALFVVAGFAPPRLAYGAAAAVAVGLPVNFAASWHTLGHISWSDLPYNYGLFAAAFVLGDDLRQRRARIERLQAHAVRLEAEHAESRRRAAELERQRIRRELHDAIGHHLSVIVLQAGAGRRLASDAARAATALGAIEATGREALGEVRRLLDLAGTPAPEAERTPQPGLDDLDRLVSQVSQAGLAVRLQVEGERRRLAPTLELSAYRIVQEALTNTVRHAGARSAAVTVRYGAAELGLSVVDDGSGGGRRGDDGRGLGGMRERALLFGGRFEAGPCPGSGYAVNAVLPLEPAPSSGS